MADISEMSLSMTHNDACEEHYRYHIAKRHCDTDPVHLILTPDNDVPQNEQA
jgi:hypothetical protein